MSILAVSAAGKAGRDAVAAVGEVKAQLSGFYGDAKAVDFITNPALTGEELETWLAELGNTERLERVFNSVLGFDRAISTQYGHLTGSSSAMMLLVSSSAAMSALKIAPLRDSILVDENAFFEVYGNASTFDYLRVNFPETLAQALLALKSASFDALIKGATNSTISAMQTPKIAKALLHSNLHRSTLLDNPAVFDYESAIRTLLSAPNGMEDIIADEPLMLSIADDDQALRVIMNDTESLNIMLNSTSASDALSQSETGISILLETTFFKNKVGTFPEYVKRFGYHQPSLDYLRELQNNERKKVITSYNTRSSFLINSVGEEEIVYYIEGSLVKAYLVTSNTHTTVLDLGAEDTTSSVYALEVDNQKNLFVITSTNERRIRKFSSSGVFLWSSSETNLEKCVVDGEGSVYALRSNRVFKFDKHGTLLWEFMDTLRYPDALALNFYGEVLIGDRDDSSGDSYPRVTKLGTEGNLLWKTTGGLKGYSPKFIIENANGMVAAAYDKYRQPAEFFNIHSDTGALGTLDDIGVSSRFPHDSTLASWPTVNGLVLANSGNLLVMLSNTNTRAHTFYYYDYIQNQIREYSGAFSGDLYSVAPSKTLSRYWIQTQYGIYSRSPYTKDNQIVVKDTPYNARLTKIAVWPGNAYHGNF